MYRLYSPNDSVAKIKLFVGLS